MNKNIEVIEDIGSVMEKYIVDKNGHSKKENKASVFQMKITDYTLEDQFVKRVAIENNSFLHNKELAYAIKVYFDCDNDPQWKGNTFLGVVMVYDDVKHPMI